MTQDATLLLRPHCCYWHAIAVQDERRSSGSLWNTLHDVVLECRVAVAHFLPELLDAFRISADQLLEDDRLL